MPSTLLDDLTLWAAYDNNLLDSGPNSSHGTGINSPTFTTGKIGQALDLEISSLQYVHHGTDVGTDGMQEFTLACWFKPESLGGAASFQQLLHKGVTATNNKIALMHGGTGAGSNASLLCVCAAGSNAYGYSGSVLTVGVWGCYIYRYNGAFTDADPTIQNNGRCKLDANGVNVPLTFSGNIPDFSPDASANTFNVGFEGSLYEDGAFDNVAVWSRCLTDLECLEYWNGGAGYNPFAPTGGSPTGTVSSPARSSYLSPVNPPPHLLQQLGLI